MVQSFVLALVMAVYAHRKNTTGFSRVSIDFRVIPFSKYNPDYELSSVHGNRKFLIGDYFTRIDRPTVI